MAKIDNNATQVHGTTYNISKESFDREVTRGKESSRKKIEAEEQDELRPEYDFATMKGGVRSKYVERYREGSNLVRLDPDVADVFPDGKLVNDALRLVIQERQSPRPR